MSIKVLVVDDSLFMRTLVSDMLNSDPEIEVIDTAKDGAEAVNKIPKIRPDCITLDLAMPGWDGLTTLKHIMSQYPTPVVILSAYSRKDADITMECLKAGAVSFVLKPSGELSLDIETVRGLLVQEVKVAARVDVGRIRSLVVKKPERPGRKLIGISKIVVIGASTGGPQMLEAILTSLPSDFSAPIIIGQHIPSRFFTESLAEHLNRNCDLPVSVAENNEIIGPGAVYLIPSRFSLMLKRRMDVNKKTAEVSISLSEHASGILSPSIDEIMESVALLYKENTVGIILTGMGDDGVRGMTEIKKYGGKTIVQDESSLIFGMPKAVIDAGLADKVMPADQIAGAIVEAVVN